MNLAVSIQILSCGKFSACFRELMKAVIFTYSNCRENLPTTDTLVFQVCCQVSW